MTTYRSFFSYGFHHVRRIEPDGTTHFVGSCAHDEGVQEIIGRDRTRMEKEKENDPVKE